MKNLRVLLIFILFSILLSCGGAGTPLPKERPISAITGHAVDALIVNGSIAVYDYDKGTKGELLANTTTDEFGAYKLSMQSDSRPVLLEISGGYYTEEASGTRVLLSDGQFLRALTFYVSGEPLEVMVTPFTNLAAGLATYKITHGINVNNAITEATSAITSFIGLDILGTYPRNITDVNNATSIMTDEHRYGFFTASLSAWTQWASRENAVDIHTIYTSIALSQLMYQDIETDGLLDGIVVNNDVKNNLSFGSVPLTANVYRAGLAQQIIFIASDPVNKTSLGVIDVLKLAADISQSTHAMFGDLAPQPVDATGPTIAALEAVGQYKGGIFSYAVAVDDFVGIRSVDFDLDGKAQGNASVPENPTIEIDSTIFPDGDHQIGVRATDNVGNETYVQYAIKFDNSNPFVSVTSPLMVNNSNYTIAGTYLDQGVGLGAIYVDDVEATKNTDGTWFLELTLIPGVNNLSIRLVDQVANTVESEASISLDIASPAVKVGYSMASFELNGEIYSGILNDNDFDSEVRLLISYTQLSTLGIEFNRAALNAHKTPYLTISVDDVNSSGVFTRNDELLVQYSYSIDGAIISDFRDANRSTDYLDDDAYLIPFSNEYLSVDWYQTRAESLHTITIKVVDNAGNVTIESFSFKAKFDLQDVTIVSIQRDAIANLYTYVDGVKGGIIGTCITDNIGQCRYGLYTDEKPILLEVMGGSYVETATGSSIELSDKKGFRSIVLFDAKDVTAIVTPLTHLATVYTDYQMTKMPFKDAYSSAKIAFKVTYGFDVFSTVPIDVTDTASIGSVLTIGHKYGFQLAALSQYSAWVNVENGLPEHAQYNTYTLVSAMENDILFDGNLNGNAGEGVVSLGALVLDDYQYRFGIGSQLLEFVKNGANQSGFGIAEIFDYADLVSKSSQSIYANTKGYHLDASGPRITLSIANSWVKGSILLGPDVNDIDGDVASVSFRIDEALLGNANDAKNPSYKLDTSSYVDGPHTLGISAIDEVGNPSSRQFVINIDNTPAIVELTSADMSNLNTFIVRGTVLDSGSGIESITVGNAVAVINADQSWSANVILDKEGSNNFSLVATDIVGNMNTTQIIVLRDTTRPVVTVTSSDKTAISNFTIKGFVEDPGAGIKSITVGDVPAIINGNSSWSATVTLKKEGNNNFSIVATDAVGNVRNIDTTVLLDTTLPAYTVTSSNKTNQSKFLVTGKILGRNSGSTVQSITVDGNAAILKTNGNWSVNINLAQEGNNNLALIVTDAVGNMASDSIIILLDRTPPNITLTSDKITGKKVFLITGTANDEGVGLKSISVGNAIATLNNNDTWSASVILDQEGENRLRVLATDAVGNEFTTNASIFLDRTAPTTTITSAQFSGDVNFVVTGSSRDDGTGVKRVSVSGVIASLNSDDSWSVNVKLNREKENRLSLVVTDTVGNTKNGTIIVDLDTSKPSMSLISQNISQTSAYAMIGSVTDDGSGVQSLTIGGQRMNVNTDGSWRFNTALTTEGVNSFSVQIMDQVGNTFNDTINILRDTVPPEFVMMSSTIVSTNATVVSGTFVEEGSGLASMTVAGLVPTLDMETKMWSLSLPLTEGENKFVVEIRDKAGFVTLGEVVVNRDTTKPLLSATSSQYVGSQGYTLTGTYGDNVSGIRSILVNNNAATLDPSTKTWRYEVSLTGGDNIFDITVIDNVGNKQVVNYSVTFDSAAPIRTDFFSLVEYSDGAGGSYTDTLQAVNPTGNPLYIVTDKLSSGALATVAEFDNVGIPYFGMSVRDVVFGSRNTAGRDIVVNMQYKINDQVIGAWKRLTPSPASEEKRSYVIPLSNEGLNAAWASTSREDIHRIEIELTDALGNTLNYAHEFKVEFVAPTLIFSLSDVNNFTESFDDRTETFNKEKKVNAYTFTNTSDNYLYLKMADLSQHSISNTYERVVRENNVRLKNSRQWQVKPAYALMKTTAAGQSGTKVDVCYADVLPNWQDVESLSNWNGTRWVNLLPSVTAGDIEIASSDSPNLPAPSDWINKAMPDSLYNASSGADQDLRISAGSDDRYAYVDCYRLTTLNWRERSVYTYVSEPDYPRNALETDTERTDFSSSRFEVRDDNNNLVSTVADGWYKIPPELKVTLSKFIATPAIATFNDTDVAEVASFSSYAEKKYDKSFTWRIRRPIEITRVAGDKEGPTGILLLSTVGEGFHEYSINR